MPKSDLHTYPKTFNRWGHLKAFPVRKPMTVPFVFILVTGTAWIMGFYMFRSSAFDFFNRADIFQKDVVSGLVRKHSFWQKKDPSTL